MHMALINCPECGNPVSTYAQYCPKCGYPINNHTPEPSYTPHSDMNEPMDNTPHNNMNEPTEDAPTEKKPSILKGILNAALIVMGIIALVCYLPTDSGRNRSRSKSQNATTTTTATEEEYIVVTSDELVEAIHSNALKAQRLYKGKDLTIIGYLGNIDSNGEYFCIDSNDRYSLTNIQCFMKTAYQRNIIMELIKGDIIIVTGRCAEVGEVMGYFIDVEEIETEEDVRK